MTCSGCTQALPDNARFCHSCGVPTEINDDAWWYMEGEEQRGPCTRDQLIALLMTGVITPDTPVKHVKMIYWLPIATLPAFRKDASATGEDQGTAAGMLPQDQSMTSAVRQPFQSNSGTHPTPPSKGDRTSLGSSRIELNGPVSPANSSDFEEIARPKKTQLRETLGDIWFPAGLLILMWLFFPTMQTHLENMAMWMLGFFGLMFLRDRYATSAVLNILYWAWIIPAAIYMTGFFWGLKLP